jgi:predicted alpha/beta superfamily hydrolase
MPLIKLSPAIGLIFVLSVSLFSPAAAAPTETIVSAEKIRIRSTILNEDRELSVAKPANYDLSKASYPVLYVLDGGLNFPFTAEIVRFLAAYRLIPEMIVVGVENTDRTRDMTPNKTADAHERYATAGGADRFLKFLGDEAIPQIEKSYRALPSRTIVGHSLSGLLVVHALLTRPELFEAYIAISPSLWWNKYEYYDKIQTFYKSRATLRKDVFVSLADESEKEPDQYVRLQDAFEKSAPKDLKIYVQFFKQENHISTAVVSTTNALLKIFSSAAAPRKAG